MKNYTIRLATEADAPAFAQWVAGNPRISPSDVEAVSKTTPLTIVVEADGQPEGFIPMIPAMTIGFIGLRPGQDARTTSAVLAKLREGLLNLQDALKINEAYVHTKAEMPIAKWALKHGFKEKEQDTYVLQRR